MLTLLLKMQQMQFNIRWNYHLLLSMNFKDIFIKVISVINLLRIICYMSENIVVKPYSHDPNLI